jgi:CMP-N-acetylneuraminic acid synthetase
MVKGNICVIPARGGSKRIPKKNILEFFGKPMIAWTIEAALASRCFEKIVVSTDCDEIAEISKKYGADVPFLRDSKSDDVSPVSEATIATLNQLKEKLGLEYENVVQLMANCPLRNSSDIEKSMDNFLKKKLDFQISSFKFGWMNPWWAVRISDQGKPVSMFPEARLKRSQDLPELFCPTGAIWMAKTSELLRAGSFYGPNYEFYEIDWSAAVDIDDDEDLEMAKAFYILKTSKNNEA